MRVADLESTMVKCLRRLRGVTSTFPMVTFMGLRMTICLSIPWWLLIISIWCYGVIRIHMGRKSFATKLDMSFSIWQTSSKTFLHWVDGGATGRAACCAIRCTATYAALSVLWNGLSLRYRSFCANYLKLAQTICPKWPLFLVKIFALFISLRTDLERIFARCRLHIRL